MKNILIALLYVATIVMLPRVSRANFSGMSFNESPTAPMEMMIDEILGDSKISAKVSPNPGDLRNVKVALLKACSTDRDVLEALVKVRDKVLPEIKTLPTDEQEKEYDDNAAYIRTAALEFGYRAQ